MIIRRLGLCVAVLAALVPCARARAQGAAPAGPPVVTAIRSWTAPANTRVVIDFSTAVIAAMPDSGRASRLVVSVPVAGITGGGNVPAVIAVRDSAVDSVLVSYETASTRFTIVMAPGSSFRAFSLPADADKPFRIVVDVTRPGAEIEEQRRLASVAAAKRRDRVRLVYIDAGHGGDDAGARGPGGVLEKNVTLGVARSLAAQLNAVPGIRALLTRDSDFFIPLQQRFRIAEQARADLFLSIHCNSSHRRGHGSGTEVYFLSLRGAEDAADRDLADLENAADLVGGVPPQAEDDVVGVLYNVRRNSALERSQLLAETVLDHIAADRRVESRGIKQAAFAVLKSVEFPSVLVETAFINNPREARMLRDPRFQQQISQQIASGVVAYFGRTGVTLPGHATVRNGAGGDTLRAGEGQNR